MTTKVSYSEARARLAELWDEAESSREPITLTRRGKEDMVLLAADELSSMLETVHLLQSPANAKRLLAALERARSGDSLETLTVEELGSRVGLTEPQSEEV